MLEKTVPKWYMQWLLQTKGNKNIFIWKIFTSSFHTWLRQFSPCWFQCHSYDERTKLQHSLKLMVPKATVCCSIKCKCSTQHGHESQIWQILQHLMIKYDKTLLVQKWGILSYYNFPLRFAQYLRWLCGLNTQCWDRFCSLLCYTYCAASEKMPYFSPAAILPTRF